jgi:magnesium chelatase subunit D
MSTPLPFTAVVGQDRAKTALLLAAVDPRLGGVLLRGDKGSAKTTLARGLAALLPGDAPFVELPLGAGEDRVLGSLDLRALLTEGTPTFRPGLLASAHDGVLYVDEINLLADHLVDALLDVAVSGVNRVERDGLSHTHPARFVLIASMNPEEGELRPQLLDRFGLSVEVRAPADVSDRVEAVRRQLAFEREGVSDAMVADAADLRRRVESARRAEVRVDDDLLRVASSVAVAVGAEGLRADLMLVRAARAHAALGGRPAAELGDLRAVAELVLGHRRRRRPFEEPGIDREVLEEAFAGALEDGSVRGGSAGTGRESGPGSGSGSEAEAGSEVTLESGEAGAPQGAARRGAPTKGALADDAVPEGAALDGAAPGGRVDRPSGDRPTEVTLPVRGTGRPGSSTLSAPSGRAAVAPAGRRGRRVTSVPFEADLPVDPVGSAVALAGRRAAVGRSDAAVTAEDLRGVRREQAVGALVVFVVDASGSMGVEHRMAGTKAAVFGLLADAYRHRCRVALVAFRGEGAQTVLRPTGSVEVARARLADLATGGASPIDAGLREAAMLADRASPGTPVVVVVVTDGRATAVGADPRQVFERAVEVARSLRRRGVEVVVVDSERGPGRLGLARRLADVAGAVAIDLEELASSDPLTTLIPDPEVRRA